MASFFSGKTVLITGASRGIGEALSVELARQGAHLILIARSAELLETLVKKLQTPPQQIRAYPCDLSQPEQVHQLAENLAAETLSVDGAIFNAGVGLYGKSVALSEEDVRELFEVNFFSIRTLIAALLPLLQKGRDPRIVLVSSVVSWRSIPRLGVYCASKAALNLFTEALRLELKKFKIKVTNTYPGRTRTDFAKNAKSSGDRPFPYFGGASPDKVAKKILRAMRKGKRDAFISLGNRIFLWWNFLLPRTLDWILGKALK